MDKWLIKPKLTYEQLAAKLAIAESELATLKELKPMLSVGQAQWVKHSKNSTR